MGSLMFQMGHFALLEMKKKTVFLIITYHILKNAHTQSWTKYIGRSENPKKKIPSAPSPIINVEFFCDSDCRTFFNIDSGGGGEGRSE